MVNAGFHGELAALRDDAVASMPGQAYAAAHDNTVHEGDVRQGSGRCGIEPILISQNLRAKPEPSDALS